MPVSVSAPATPGGPVLSLLGGFSLRIDGVSAALPMHARRVLAFLSLDKFSQPDCDRGVLAERLWPDSSVERSRASLRTALWRIRMISRDLVCDDIDRVRLADEIDVDVHRLRHRAEGILAAGSECCLQRARLVSRTTELLPGWDEAWLVLAREQLRQLRLHALEIAARRLSEQGRTPEAIDLMLGVILEEPLRESAQTALIEAHLRHGNVSEARRQLQQFAKLLWDELGLHPSPELFDKVGVARPATGQLNGAQQGTLRPSSHSHANRLTEKHKPLR